MGVKSSPFNKSPRVPGTQHQFGHPGILPTGVRMPDGSNVLDIRSFPYLFFQLTSQGNYLHKIEPPALQTIHFHHHFI